MKLNSEASTSLSQRAVPVPSNRALSGVEGENARTELVDAALEIFVQRYPAHSYLIAYSGGLDSHVLLHACAALRVAKPELTLRAIHIDHGLQAESAAWAQHCQQVCAQLNIPLHIAVLYLTPASGQSPEAQARDARYQAFSEHLCQDEILLTAHHQDDQAETLLLNLLRGAGAAGLAAMPESRPFAQTLLGRPLLTRSRQALMDYAEQHHLSWIEDPSNQCTAFDRNYLRHEILPRLQQRWPATTQMLERAAQWQAENQQLLASLLTQQLANVAGSQPDTLSVSRLLACEQSLQKALLRQWLAQLGFRMPSAKKLAHVLHDVLRAKMDAKPCVSWEGCEIRRFRGDIYAMSPLPALDQQQVILWSDLERALPIPALETTLDAALLDDYRTFITEAKSEVTVRLRCGGEKLLLPSGKHVSLKLFLQQQNIPPWQRSRIPLVYADKQIVVIPDYFKLQKQQFNAE